MHSYCPHRTGLGACSAVDAGVFSVGYLFYDLARLPFAVEEGIGRTGVNAGPASLAYVVVAAEFTCKWFFKRDGTYRTDLGAPAAVHTSVQVDMRLTFELQAAVLGQPPILQLYARLRADLGT
ncbi:Uncharacterised protein [uncultured archaeon]|nr:Uncharacterised protein [uncultured archaeon]